MYALVGTAVQWLYAYVQAHVHVLAQPRRVRHMYTERAATVSGRTRAEYLSDDDAPARNVPSRPPS